jgi:hypothetical protein
MVGLNIRKISVLVVLFIICTLPALSQTYNRSMIDAVLINPKYGASQVDRFDLIINVSNVSVCRYSSNPALNFSEIISPINQFSTSDGKSQRIVDFSLPLAEGDTKPLYMLCKTPQDYVNDGFPINITLSIDKTEPKILSAVADPFFVIEIPKTVLTVTTDDDSVCKFDKTIPQMEEFRSFFEGANISKFNKTNILTLIPPNIEDNKEYTYTVSCMNRAGLFASEIKAINFKVNLSAENAVVKTFPKGYIKGGDAEILVETNRDSTCRYALDSTNYASTFPQEHKKIHFIQKQNLEDRKTYTYYVRCEFDQGKPSVIDTSVSFTIDRLPPKPLIIQTDTQSCTKNSLSATFLTNDTDLAGVYFRILGANNTVVKNFVFSNVLKVYVDNLNLAIGEKYYWEVFGTDNTGNNGTSQKSSGTLVLGQDNVLCLPNAPPSLNKAAKITENGISLTLECKDDDGCQSISYLLLNSKNPLCTCSTCDYAKYDLPLFGINENSTLCYKAMDNKNVSGSGHLLLNFLDCTGTETGCCAGKKAVLCEENCTPVALVECNPDKIDSDGDGITDVIEVKFGLNPNNSTDALSDFDKDGLTNKDEVINYNTNITKADSDGDSYSDKEEIEKNTNPNNKNEFPKDLKKDSDTDGIPDYKEKECGLDPNKKDSSLDNDEDGLTNKEECLEYGTNLEEKDTDGDKVSDKAEIDAETDPNDSEDYPKSPLLTIVLVIVLLGVIGAVVYFFVVKKKGNISMGQFNAPRQNKFNPTLQNKYNPNIQKVGVNFNQAKNEMGTETSRSPIPEKSKDDLDLEIKKKKEWIRVRQMTSIFDEFGKDPENKKKIEKSEDLINEIEKERAKERKGVFDRLEDISKDSTFEEIQKIKKKKP